MCKLKPVLAVLGIIFFSSPIQAANNTAPKWCSSNQLSKVEKVICADAVLSSADTLINGLYTEIMSYRGKEGHEGMWYREVKSNQKDWMAKRNKSTKRMVILDTYMSRIQELYIVLQNRLF